MTTLKNKHKVNFQRSEAGNHRAQAFVERANRTLGEKIFTHQYAQEMAHAQKSKNRSREWVERLPAILKVMNNEVTRLTGKEPASSIKLKEVPTQDVTYNRPVGLNEKDCLHSYKLDTYWPLAKKKAVKDVELLIRYGAWRSMIYRVVSYHQDNQYYII